MTRQRDSNTPTGENPLSAPLQESSTWTDRGESQKPAEKPRRKLLPTKPALLVLTKVAKLLDGLTPDEQRFVIEGADALYPSKEN